MYTKRSTNFYFSLNFFICALILLIGLGISNASSPGKSHNSNPFNANITLNPGCEDQGGSDCNGAIWLAHASSKSSNKFVHYLWGTVGAPVLALATYRDVDSELNITWAMLQDPDDNSDSVIFNIEPESLFMVSFPNLILFNDSKDTGIFDEKDNHTVVPMEDFTWMLYKQSDDHVVFVTKEYKNKPLEKNTNITLKLTVYNEDGRSSVLPKLLTTPESSQFELSLQNLTIDFANDTSSLKDSHETTKPISGYSQPRWAVQMVLFTDEEDDLDTEFKIHQQKSLDDEYSPGVFHLNDITTPKTKDNNGEGGYLQWRPISYLSKERDVNNSTFPNIADLASGLPNNTDALKKSLVNAIFGQGVTSLSIANTYISFGQPEDGFYTETEFVLWVVTMGYGTPPKENFSTVVIIVIALGIGIPLVMFIVGGIFVYIRKRRQNGSLELLVDEELPS